MKRLEIIKQHLNSLDKEICIVAYGRSPIRRALTEYSSISESELAGQTLRQVLEKYQINPKEVEEMYLGKVFTSNNGQAFFKQVLSSAGVGDHISGSTVNKLCASGMKAVSFGALSIACGHSDCVVAGGVERMGITPYLLSLRKGIETKVRDSMFHDGFPDAVTKEPPIVIAEQFNKAQNYTLADLNSYATISCTRAASAVKAGKFTEIVPISVPKSSKKITADSIKPLKIIENSAPVLKNGINTAGNSCGTDDGASFLVLCTREKAQKCGWKVLGTIVSFADGEQNAKLFPTSPSIAIQKALKSANLNINQVDYMELNEPFACVVLAISKILKFPIKKINVYGGAICLGHPLGSSGCRIIGTLMSVLDQEGGKIGIASICNAGGGASAIIVKKE